MASPMVDSWRLTTPPLQIAPLKVPPIPPTPARALNYRPGMLSQSKPELSKSTTSFRATPSHRGRPLMTDFSEYRLHPVKSEGSLRNPTRPNGPASPRGRDRMATVDNIELHQIPRRDSSLRFSSPPASIKIVAGEQTLDKQEFRVDETLIRSNSGFFDRGFTRREFLNDDKPEMIKLPKTSAKVFQVYLGWINSRQIALTRPLRFSQMHMDEVSAAFELLIDCYEAGKKLQDNDFKDVIIDTIIQLATATRVFPINYVKKIYEMTDTGSAFRRLIVDMALHANVPEWWQDKRNRACCTEEALWDIVAAIKMHEQFPDQPAAPFCEDTCIYHHHRFFKRPCYKEKIGQAHIHPLHRGGLSR